VNAAEHGDPAANIAIRDRSTKTRRKLTIRASGNVSSNVVSDSLFRRTVPSANGSNPAHADHSANPPTQVRQVRRRLVVSGNRADHADSGMITHVVLFRPRAGLSPAQRGGLADALRTALETIPSIRRARIGRRVTHGRPYEQLMRVDYEFAALLDFDDLAGLKAYLEHPAHEALATRFFEVLEEALMYDFALNEGVDALANLL